jgi:hypothetical protein
MATVVRVQAYEVRQRLADFGLTADLLLSAVRAVAAAHAGCTENDPPAARCWDGWRMGTRRLREVLRPHGWDKDDTDTYSVIINHKDRVQIVVVNSSAGTGVVLGSPLNVARKGPKSSDSAAMNKQMVFDLAGFPEEFARRVQMAEAARYATWCLCVHVDGDEVRAELPQPVGYQRGYVAKWEERIILTDEGLPFDVVFINPSDEDDGLSPDFPIPVQRK